MNIKDLDETLTQSKCPIDISYCNCCHHKHMGTRGLPGYSGSCVWCLLSNRLHPDLFFPSLFSSLCPFLLVFFGFIEI